MDEATAELLEHDVQSGRRVREGKTKKLPIVEVFGPTLQGEGRVAGVRTTFIRFGLCDYKCVMCDSMHAVDPKQVRQNATWMTPEEAVAALIPFHLEPELRTLNCDWVTFSGGNPCIHDLTAFIKQLRAELPGVKISVETQGTLLPEWLHSCESVCVSPKGPGMGEQFEPDKFLPFLQGFQHHRGFYVKVVVFDAADLEFASWINQELVLRGLGDRMYLSVGNPYPPGEAGERQLEEERDEMTSASNHLRLELMRRYVLLTEDLLHMPDMRNVKFLPQLHVLMWGNKQGV